MDNTNYTVVVAEDEELLLKNLIQKIEKTNLGFSVVGFARTGIDAYEIVKKYSPDLLVTDIKMPILTGIELIDKVRNHYPHTHFIITSGFSDFSYAKSAIRFQVSDYLLKPIDSDELYNALKNIRDQLEINRKEYEDIFPSNMTKKPPSDIAETIKEYLLHNFTKDINLNLIAKNMSYSSSYLTKIFQQIYDTTPSKYIIFLRINKAKHLLNHNPELSIRQIGELVGYPDQSYFSRIFKKHTGVSPFDYRE